MQNVLLQQIDYKVDQTSLGVWRRFGYPTGAVFEEFVSHRRLFGLPLVHYTRGRCPETGRRIIAKGIVAVDRIAIGGLAIGHASAGVVAIGQLAIGLALGLGQASTGLLALGQLAIGIIVGLGQVVTGYVAVGQFGVGTYVLAQLGFGPHVWDSRAVSPIARQFFRSLIP